MLRRFEEVVSSQSPELPYIVAEVNTSHFGRIELAKEVILRVAQAGADCVKFQSWKPESLFTLEYLEQHRIEKRLYERFSLSDIVIEELAVFAEANQIAFSSTPYSRSEIEVLAGLGNVPFIKIASMDATNPNLIADAAKTGKPLVVSTGMSNEAEIADAVRFAHEARFVSLLHCVSLYPTPTHLANVLTVAWLKNRFPDCFPGYSDHTSGSASAVLATALGARIIEKHVSLEKNRPGFDNEMAASIEEFEQYVKDLRNAVQTLGSNEKVLSLDEISQIPKLRRSAHAARSLEAGESLSWDMIEFKRPGNGISISAVSAWIGVELVRSIPKGRLICEADFRVVS